MLIWCSNMPGAGKSNGVHQYSLFDIGPYARLQCYSMHVIEFIFSSIEYRWNLSKHIESQWVLLYDIEQNLAYNRLQWTPMDLNKLHWHSVNVAGNLLKSIVVQCVPLVVGIELTGGRWSTICRLWKLLFNTHKQTLMSMFLSLHLSTSMGCVCKLLIQRIGQLHWHTD